MRKKLATAILTLVALVLALGVETPSAGAHAVLEASKPAAGESLAQPPTEIIFYFTEAIEPNYSTAYVTGADGRRWELPNEGAFHIHTDPTNPGLIMNPTQPDGTTMPNGTYTVVWDVLSAVDGHRTKGAFAFFVGPPPLDPLPSEPEMEIDAISAPPDSLEVFVRWANFAAMAALIGAALFPFVILPAAVVGLNASEANEVGVRRALRIARVSTLLASLGLIIASCASLWMQVWLGSGDSTPFGLFRDFVSDTRYGDVWIARMALAAGAFVCSLLILVRGRGAWHESMLHPRNTPWVVLAALSLAIPVTTSLNSHAATGGDFDLSTAIDYVHLVAGGLWVGLLLQLALVILLVVPLLDDRAGFLAGSVRRFSWVAVPTVIVIVATGVIQSIDRLGGIDELFDTGYGLTLTMKILLLAPVLVIGAANLLVFGPRFVQFARQKAKAILELKPWEGAFRYGLMLEVTLAIIVLAATGLLTNTPPPRSAGSGGDSASQPTSAAPTPTAGSGFALVEDLSLSVWADPAKAGLNDVNVLVIDQDGDEEEIQSVILRFRYTQDDLGQSEAFAEPVHPPSHYIASTSDLSLPGQWEVEVIVRRPGLLDARGTVELEITA
jgi:copper transport protein